MYMCSHEADRILIDQDHAVIMFLKEQRSTAPEEVTKQVSKLFEERDASAIRARLNWLLPDHLEGQMVPASSRDRAEGLVMSAHEVFAIIKDLEEWHSINEGTHKDIQDFFAKREGHTSKSREEVRTAERDAQERQGRKRVGVGDGAQIEHAEGPSMNADSSQGTTQEAEGRGDVHSSGAFRLEPLVRPLHEQDQGADDVSGGEDGVRDDGEAVAYNSEVSSKNSSALVNSENDDPQIGSENVRHLKFWTTQEVLFPHYLLSRELSPIRFPCPRVADFPDSTSHGTHFKLKLIPYTPYSGDDPA